mmetsp:Transcript_231/g.523  ORF Transcript_231/g.523 Transcript_231/m.523 type:complete len:87 (+) Transcript_231:50-310(+)
MPADTGSPTLGGGGGTEGGRAPGDAAFLAHGPAGKVAPAEGSPVTAAALPSAQTSGAAKRPAEVALNDKRERADFVVVETISWDDW